MHSFSCDNPLTPSSSGLAQSHNVCKQSLPYNAWECLHSVTKFDKYILMYVKLLTPRVTLYQTPGVMLWTNANVLYPCDTRWKDFQRILLYPSCPMWKLKSLSWSTLVLLWSHPGFLVIPPWFYRDPTLVLSWLHPGFVNKHDSTLHGDACILWFNVFYPCCSLMIFSKIFQCKYYYLYCCP